MIALLQRVTEASVVVEGETVGAIDAGLLVLLCIERGDAAGQTGRLIERVLNHRVFADEAGRMNRSLRDIGGGLLLVPQFTLAADTTRGNRPDFTPAADPEQGRALFERAVQEARAMHARVATGRFGAHMRIRSINDGPVTLSLRSAPFKPFLRDVDHRGA
jgi:D-tyrosyl-tRNA(Tyr) deacylase